MQQAKAYLYGSLLYYLTMTKQEVTGGQRGKGEQAGVGGMWLRINLIVRSIPPKYTSVYISGEFCYTARHAYFVSRAYRPQGGVGM